MRLLHVVPTYLPAVRYGGPIVAVHGLCAALAARGHEVEVFTTNVDGAGTLDVPTGQAVLRDGVRVRYFPSSFRRLYVSSEMRKALRDAGRFDLVHSHSVYLWPGVEAGRAARRAGVPFVISPRGMLVPELIEQKNTLVKKAWLRLVERPNFSSAAAIHFTSVLEAEDAARVGLPIPASFVVPNGVALSPRPDVVRDERMLLCLGRISWKKGLDRVIEFLAKTTARLVIAGNDEEGLTPALQKLAAAHGVAERVTFAGPVYGEAKNALLASAALVVLFSHSENFGNVVLEALAMETPVVLSPEVGLAGVVSRAGAGITSLEEIESLLHDPQRRTDMGRKGRELVEREFAWPRVAGMMERHYAALAAGGMAG